MAIPSDMLDENEKLPKIKSALLADAIATSVGAVCGTSTTTTFVESSAGVGAGARERLTDRRKIRQRKRRIKRIKSCLRCYDIQTCRFTFIVLSLTNVREAVFNAIPSTLKKGVSAGIGLFIAFIGLQNGHVVVNNEGGDAGYDFRLYIRLLFTQLKQFFHFLFLTL